MNEKAYSTQTLAGLERPDGWSPIRQQLGIQAFGVNAWTAHEAGATLVSEHDEAPSGHEELYLLLSGRATFTVDGDEIDAAPGMIIFVRDPHAKRGAVAAEPGTTVLIVGARPGAAYRPRAWETNVDLFPMFDAGQFAEAKQLLLDALPLYEDQGTLLYNLACAEAQLGNRDAAFDHLRAALDHRPELAKQAPDDGDLASLRDDPRFNQIVV
jgi:tetratricopeptide (TPR) repeat protein